MPDKDNKTLINEALKSTKILDMYPKAAKELTEKLQKYFRDKNVALKVVTKDIKDGNNTLAGYEGQVADAEKTLAGLEKAKIEPATAKKLESAIKSASSALKELGTNLTVYDKFADTAEKDDAKLDQIASVLLKLGEPTLQSLTDSVITVQVQPQSVQEGFDKSWPKQAIQKAFIQVGTDMHEVGEEITKGETFIDSAATMLKRRKDAFEPGTIAACDKIDTMKDDMDKQLVKLRPIYGQAIKDLRDFGTRLKAMPD